MATKWEWTCEECGFDNAPHVNRRGPEAQAKCEQCGASAPPVVLKQLEVKHA